MALMFPNPSRSYDSKRDVIRFVGHDGMFEIPFFVDVAALPKLPKQKVSSDQAYLSAFDAARSTIQSVAREAYSNSRKASYFLTVSDFR